MPFLDPAAKPALSRPIYRTSDGTRVPSVTTVIGATFAKPGLTKWANRLGLQGEDSEAYRDQRAAEGSCVHEHIRAHLTVSDPDLEPFAPRTRAAGVVGYLRWKREWLLAHDVEAVEIERPMVSERHGYGGTPDLIARVDGRLELLDWKTSAAIYREHVVQAAAYAAMAWGNGHAIEAVRVVSVSTEAGGLVKERVETVTDVRPHFEAFLAALRLYQRMAALERAERVSA